MLKLGSSSACVRGWRGGWWYEDVEGWDGGMRCDDVRAWRGGVEV